MAKKKKVEEVPVEEVIKSLEEADVIAVKGLPEKSEKDILLEVYEFMKSRGINSISDIENKIARL
jgi:fructose-1-phosphate kinase PfkB-like protein